MTYLLLNSIFIAATIGFALCMRRYIRPWLIVATILILFILTAVFDNLIIHTGIVAYDSSKLLRVYIWKAPIEDFAYSFVIGMLGPIIWEYYEKH